jgi:hypothetical protein
MTNLSEHARFEELCALSAVGQITPAEYEALSDHMRECADCRDGYAGFADLTHAQLPMLAAEAADVSHRSGILAAIEDKRYKDRFAARAKAYGIEISRPSSVTRRLLPSLANLQPSNRLVSVVVMAALLVAVGALLHQLSGARQHEAAVSAHVNDLSGQNADLQKQVAGLLEGKRDIETDLVKTNMTRSDLNARLAEVERQLANASATIQALQTAANDSKGQTTQAQRELADAKQSLSTVSQQFAEFRASHGNDEAATVAQQVQIADLSRRVKEQEEVIDKQQKLLSVDNDVRNLMAARSLHITDVFDVDGKGKKKSAFGRVFYTEGKSLVFYAFDLDGPKLPNGKHFFQAWGQLASSSTSAVNLGIFYVDDPAQKRWMLKFDNPDVLQRLSAVFVTAEPHGGADRPTGQKLMYAYLGRDPNHP